ncbi:Uncharacterised protein [Bordetella pertussis]|nr:Uncharacterised protein [Bordetella pertussis]
MPMRSDAGRSTTGSSRQRDRGRHLDDLLHHLGRDAGLAEGQADDGVHGRHLLARERDEALAVQVGQPRAALLRQRMVGRHREDEMVLLQVDQLGIAGVEQRRAQQRHVHGMGRQFAHQLVGGGFVQHQLDAGVARLEAVQDARQHRVAGRIGEAHDDAPLVAADVFPGAALQFVDVAQGAPGVLEHGRARHRQGQAARLAVEQHDAQFILQLADGGRQGRLGHVQALGGSVEVQGFRKHDELLQLTKIHGYGPGGEAEGMARI